MNAVIRLPQETGGAYAKRGEKNEGIEDRYPDVQLREVDIQTDLETAEEYGARTTPWTLVYATGKQTAEVIGIVDRDDPEAAIGGADQQSIELTHRLASIIRG